MDKELKDFLNDYTLVLRYKLGHKDVEIEDVNDILLSNKYYPHYQVEMKNEPDYQQAFLNFYNNEFNEKLTIAKNYLADKKKVKNKIKM